MTRCVRSIAGVAERLVDVHHGRARADFQVRLREGFRAVERMVEAAYRDRERRLTTALALPGRGEHHEARPRNGAGSRLTQLTEVAHELDVVLGRVDV